MTDAAVFTLEFVVVMLFVVLAAADVLAVAGA